MPLSPIPVYKEDLLLGQEERKIPILFSGTVIIANPVFHNEYLNYFAGWLIPAVSTEIGEIRHKWEPIWLNQKQFVNFSIPYFPSTYELYFKASNRLRAVPFTLNIWELT